MKSSQKSPRTRRRSAKQNTSNLLRHPRSLALGLGFAAASLSSAMTMAGSPSASAPTMDVSEIRPGMKGHAVTVFAGEQSDRFDIEVLDVMRDFVTGQDAILFHSPDPRLRHSGIVGGMSGSPVYINDKLVGAVAYGFPFSKDPIGGITPIADMLEVNQLPYRPEIVPGHPEPPRKQKARRRGSRRVRAMGRSGNYAWADTMLGIGTDPRPPRQLPGQALEYGAQGNLPPGSLEALGSPLSLSGLGASASSYLSQELGMTPTYVSARQSKSGSRKAQRQAKKASELELKNPDPKSFPKHNWKGGDSVSVVLIDGDNAASSNGTVTWVGGPQNSELLAYGHPMFGYGPSNLPIANARVHTIIPSYRRSVKMASHLHRQGTMIQDRQPAIVGRTGVHARMIPVSTVVEGAEPEFAPRLYQSQVAVDPGLTPKLVTALMLDAIEEGSNDGTELVLKTEHIIDYQDSSGRHQVSIDEETFFAGGVIRNVAGRHRALLLVSALLDNDFEVASIASIRQKATLNFGAPVEGIESLQLVQDDVRAGEVVSLKVRLKGRYGEERDEIVKIRIPEDAGGEKVAIEIAGGEWASPYRPVADSLDDLVQTIAQGYSARTLVASVFRSAEGLATRDGLMTHLPDSVLETLSPGGSTNKSLRFKRVSRRVLKKDKLIRGSQTIEVYVLPARNR